MNSSVPGLALAVDDSRFAEARNDRHVGAIDSGSVFTNTLLTLVRSVKRGRDPRNNEASSNSFFCRHASVLHVCLSRYLSGNSGVIFSP